MMTKKKSVSKNPSARKTARKKAAKKKISSKKTPAGKTAKKKATTTPGRKPAGKDFAAVFTALRDILKPYEGRLSPRDGGPGYYYLESLEPTYKDRPMFFAGVKAGKNYISYHLVPVYTNPELNQKISPELKKHMQGKACFNFTAVDPELFRELRALTKAGYKVFKDRGWV